MSPTIKLPDEQRRNINRYSTHKETFLSWLVEAFTETKADQTDLTAATQAILAGQGGVHVSPRDLMPMAEAIRDCKIRNPQQIAKIADEMISQMKKVNAWYAANLNQDDNGWPAHEGHKFYANQLERAINCIRRGSDTTSIATTDPAPYIQKFSPQATNAEFADSMHEASVPIELTVQSSNGISNMYKTAPKPNGSNIVRQFPWSRTLSSTQTTVVKSSSSGKDQSKDDYCNFGYATWRSEIEEETSSEKEDLTDTTHASSQMIINTDIMEHEIEPQIQNNGSISSRSDPQGFICRSRSCLE